MARKLKFDAEVIKGFFFHYGDKLALGISAALTLLLVGLGLLNASSASKVDWARDLETATSAVRSGHQNAPEKEVDKTLVSALEPALYQWKPHFSSFLPGPLINLQELPDVKRRNPQALALKGNPESFQLDYVRGLYFCHDINRAGRKIMVFGAPQPGAAGGNPAAMPGQRGAPMAAAAGVPVKAVEPKRMVVVNGIFPMREQLEEFRKAFRLSTQKELFDVKENLPRILGLEVIRFEVTPEGNGEQTTLYSYNKNRGDVTASKDIQEVLSKAFYDQETLAPLEPFIHAGLVGPMPLLANAAYPKVNLPGIEPPAAEEKGDDPMNPMNPMKGGNPMRPGFPPKRGMPGQFPKGPMDPAAMKGPAGGAAGGGGGEEVAVPWRTLPAELRDRLEGKINPLHPLGQLDSAATAPALEEKKGNGRFSPTPMPMPGARGVPGNGWVSPFEKLGLGGAGVQPMLPGPNPMGLPPRGPDGAKLPGSAPGAGNAQWGFDALVRFIDVGVEAGKTYRYQIKVWLANPNYGRKNEVAFEQLAKIKEFESAPVTTPTISIPGEYQYYAVDQTLIDALKNPTQNRPHHNNPDEVPLQVHRWFDYAKDAQNNTDYPVGDWAILDRFLAKRGDYVGAYQRYTKLPVWDKSAGAFEIPQMKQQRGKNIPGVPLDFVPPPDPGKKNLTFLPPVLVDFQGGRKDAPRLNIFRDEAAYDVLILTPEGKLTIRNSREDADPATPEGKEREERVDQAREHIEQAENGGVLTPGNPAMPGVGRNAPPGVAIPGLNR